MHEKLRQGVTHNGYTEDRKEVELDVGTGMVTGQGLYF